jgi:hypothetical protein
MMQRRVAAFGTAGWGRSFMGLVIRFPDVWRNARAASPKGEEATVVILPVIRIERPPETASAPRNTRPASRRRKRPASRS